jgi:hypothetical protein
LDARSLARVFVPSTKKDECMKTGTDWKLIHDRLKSLSLMSIFALF